MRASLRKQIENLVLALVLMAFIVSAATMITLNFKPLYSFDIDYLDIPARSGMSREEIVRNYDELISYNSMFHTGALELPTLGMSPEGRQHFVEVRNIFVFIQGSFFVSAILLAVGARYKLRRKEWGFLPLGAALTIGLPILLGGLIGANWNAFFVGFHKIFFKNDYWIFDATTDPVIRILPNGFFLHCAVMLLGIILALSGAALVSWRILRKRTNNISVEMDKRHVA